MHRFNYLATEGGQFTQDAVAYARAFEVLRTKIAKAKGVREHLCHATATCFREKITIHGYQENKTASNRRQNLIWNALPGRIADHEAGRTPRPVQIRHV